MDALFFGNENAEERVYLHGSGMLAPVRGAIRQPVPQALPDGRVEEIITVECKAGDIRTWINGLEWHLTQVNHGLARSYLWIIPEPGAAPVGARLLHGRYEALGNGSSDRLHGFQGVQLHLVRDNWLAEPVSGIPLQNANGVGNTSGLLVVNHSDGGEHINFADVVGDEVRGTQPTPARLVIDVGGPEVRRLGKIVVGGGRDLWNTAGGFDHVLEGEAAAAGAGCTAMSSVSNLSASSGLYQNLQWTAVTEVALYRWTISSERLAWLAGRGLRPVARLHNLPPANCRLRWKLLPADGSGVIDQSAQTTLDATSRLQILPAFFPPVTSSQALYQAFILEAWLECPTAGVKQLDLDFVHLFPLENFVYFQPVTGLTENHSLVMDWEYGECLSQSAETGEKTITHSVTGAPLLLFPGRNHRIYVLYETNLGFPPSGTVQVRLQAGARWIEP